MRSQGPQIGSEKGGKISNPLESSKVSSSNSSQFSKPTNTHAREVSCFKCLSKGHIASQCPNNRVMTMLEDGTINSK